MRSEMVYNAILDLNNSETFKYAIPVWYTDMKKDTPVKVPRTMLFTNTTCYVLNDEMNVLITLWNIPVHFNMWYAEYKRRQSRYKATKAAVEASKKKQKAAKAKAKKQQYDLNREKKKRAKKKKAAEKRLAEKKAAMANKKRGKTKRNG